MKKIRFIFGTRPEAIKCAPLIIELKKHPQQFDVTVLVTAQHREMLDQVISFFEIPVDDDLNLMTPNQNLSQLTSDAIRQITPILKKKPTGCCHRSRRYHHRICRCSCCFLSKDTCCSPRSRTAQF